MSSKIQMYVKCLFLCLVVGIVGGCATRNCCEAPAPSVSCCEATSPVVENCVTTTCGQRNLAPVPVKFTAVGYGAPGAYSQYTHGQQKLMAMRAAQVDAYRNLAEQVYGFRIWGNTAVSAFATQNDSVRSYVDAFIRGAKIVNVTTIADGNFEATVELELSQSFYNCLTKSGSCAVRAPVSGCVAAGCVSTSAGYISN